MIGEGKNSSSELGPKVLSGGTGSKLTRGNVM